MKKLVLLILAASLWTAIFGCEVNVDGITINLFDMFYIVSAEKIGGTKISDFSEEDVFFFDDEGLVFPYGIFASGMNEKIENSALWMSLYSRQKIVNVDIRDVKIEFIGRQRYLIDIDVSKTVLVDKKSQEEIELYYEGIGVGDKEYNLWFGDSVLLDISAERLLPDFIKESQDLRKFKRIKTMRLTISFRVNGGELQRQTLDYKIKVRSIPGWKLMMMQ